MDTDHELESNREYQRILAELSPDERLRILGGDFDLHRQLSKKRDYRRTISELPPEKKLALLEELRRRAQMLQGRRRSPPPSPVQKAKPGRGSSGVKSLKSGLRSFRKTRPRGNSHRFGGRATVGGVNYEVRIAAAIAVKILSGARCSVWRGISGADVSSITMQAPELVDDIVLNLKGDPEASAFISAKERSGIISLTPKSRAFADTVKSFVGQFLKLSIAGRRKSRFVWAVPSTVGRALTLDLADTLETLRMDGGDRSLSKFMRARQPKQAKALDSFLILTRRAWKKQTAKSPTDEELREFLGRVHVELYDFELGQHLERQAEDEIRSHIADDPKEAQRIWEKLEHFFAKVDQRGVLVTPGSLRKALVTDGIRLKHPPDYADDIAKLEELTTRNLERLKEHTSLPFDQKAGDAIHLPRVEELSALVTAAKAGNLLLTGEPGCGKSGLIHSSVERLRKDGFPTVLLLAEEIFGPQAQASANPLGISHALDEVLQNWPGGAGGFLVTDALDAVRDAETQKRLRQLLHDVQKGRSGWTVIASVREFDLKFGRELREAFPGTGVAGHASGDFAGVAHFHVTRLSETELDQLAGMRPEIFPFIDAARKNPKSAGIHRSPFYLRLAAELLRDNVPASRLADWASPALLLRKFWEARVKGSPGEGERELALETICRRMVSSQSMTISLKELSLGSPERNSVNELRSRGILQSPVVRLGTSVGGDEIRFTHHLLHDYAVARSLIPETPGPFCDFAVRKPLLAVFYRQSFLFALEELWDGPNGREGYWESALRLEGVANMHSLTRILAPVLAVRRIETLSDLQALLTAVSSSSNSGSPGHKALLHLASGLQDAGEDAIRTGSVGWCGFVEGLSNLLTTKPFVEWPLVQILARLNVVKVGTDLTQRLALNAAGRRLLGHHVAQKVSKERQYPARVAVETVCRTFTAAPAESERALLSLLLPARLAQFPHHDLRELASYLGYLGTNGETVVLRLFEAAFANEPAPGEYEDTGSLIMSMSFQTRDQWHMVRYALAGYYEARNGENAALMTEVACIAWNSVVQRRVEKRSREETLLATIQFRGVECNLVEDYSHIWGRSFEHEENRILSHFEQLLAGWAAAGDTQRLNLALDRFAASNRTSLMWTVFLEAGAEHPSTLGAMLESVLNEPLFLTHQDYAYGGSALLGALHRVGNAIQRERLERLILDLPNNVRLRNEADRNPTPSWVEQAQNRLLGTLEESNIMLAPVRDLRRQRQTLEPLPENRRPEGPRITSHTYSNEELAEKRGINLKEPSNAEMYRLQQGLNPLLDRSKGTIDLEVVEHNWPLIEKCELAVTIYSALQPQMAQQLWGYLVGACENIVGHVTSWPKTDERWKTVRRILLKAATDRFPEGEDEQDEGDDDRPSWGWPAPRLDAACGLPFLANRLGRADHEVSAALRQLARDKSRSLRFNLAERLAVLAKPAPDLMWELIDTFIANEGKFSVLEAVLRALNGLWEAEPEKVKPRIRQITDRATQGASYDRHIHQTLASTYLFRFLRTGDSECFEFIAGLLAECDSERANNVLASLLHETRAGGWLTAGDGVKSDAYADEVRGRAWGFFSKLLASAQAKLQQHREEWDQLRAANQQGEERLKEAESKIKRTLVLVDGVAMQLFFACGALHEGNRDDKVALTPDQLRRFWHEAAPLLEALVKEPHPHTAHQMVQTLHHLVPCSPSKVFLLATESIRNSASQGRFQYESLAVGDVVKLIQRVLADYRDIFHGETGEESECLKALLAVLDLFVEAGWAEARQLTHRLEEIYR